MTKRDFLQNGDRVSEGNCDRVFMQFSLRNLLSPRSVRMFVTHSRAYQKCRLVPNHV